jgi:hypothetical protein
VVVFVATESAKSANITPIRTFPVEGKRIGTLGNPRVPPDKSVISFNLHAATFVNMGLGIVKFVVVVGANVVVGNFRQINFFPTRLHISGFKEVLESAPAFEHFPPALTA